MGSKFMSNMSRTFSNSGFSRTYSSAPKPFHFTKLHQANMSPLPAPTTMQPKKDKRSNLVACCCCCFTGCVSMLITAAIGLGIAALIIWLVLRPIHMPTYSVENATVAKFSYAPASHALDAALDFTIVAENRNGKIAIKYESIGVDTSYLTSLLTPSTLIPGFYHGHHNVTRLPVRFATAAFQMDPISGDLLQRDLASGSNVTLLMKVNIAGHLKIGAIPSPVFNRHVLCTVSFKPPSVASPASPAAVTCKRL